MIFKPHFTLLFISFLFSFPGKAQQYSIADWFNDMDAAVSITFDDGCSQQFSSAGNPAAWGPSNPHGARGILDSLNMKGTFFIITDRGQSCDYFDWTTAVGMLDAAGHEVGSHTVTHPNLDSVAKNNPAQLDYEMKKSKDTLNYYLSRQKCETIAYPMGVGGMYYPYYLESGAQKTADSLSDVLEAKVREAAHKYYITGRAAGVGPEGYDTYQTAKNKTYFPDYYFQIESMAIYDTTSIVNYSKTIDNAIKNSGWFIPMYHIFNMPDPDEGLTITTAGFRQQMDSIHSRRNNLWIAPYVDVFKYFAEKRAATIQTVKYYDGTEMIISLTDTLPDNIYDDSLTLLIKNCSWAGNIQRVTQGGINIPFSVSGNTISLNVVPDRGDIAICTGCSVTSVSGNSSSSQEYLKIHPNPAMESSVISYQVKETGSINISLYTPEGSEIKTIVHDNSAPGDYSLTLSTSDLASGFYICRFSCNGSVVETKKLVLVK